MTSTILTTDLENILTVFPCSSCGLCCQSLSNNPFAYELNRGDGICRHFNLSNNLCNIYEDRPLICRVEKYYQLHLKEQYQWEEFVELNLQVCEQLQQVDNDSSSTIYPNQIDSP